MTQETAAPSLAIRRLPAELVREIAAGEVVASPADALRELVENALDAGADRLEVTLEGGGRDLIRVRDNGCGIPRELLPLALETHCTSKLERLDRIVTLGFRGEGLYALRNAGRLALTSRPGEQLGGSTVRAVGEDLQQHDHPAPAGTTAELRELFRHLPARRRALGQPPAETRACQQVLARYLLHRPQLKLVLVQDGETRWNYAGGSPSEAVKFLWGPVIANRLLELEATQGASRVRGLISRPELARARRDRLLLAVNGRPVEWPPALLAALTAAYRELLPGGQYPVAVVDLELPPEEVLVNTSPDKRRVRLLAEPSVEAFLRRAVEEVLARHPLAPALPEPSAAAPVRPAAPSGFPELGFLGSFRDLYLLAEAGDELWVIDQHAAHERILYEELEARFRSEAPLEPAHAELIGLSREEQEAYLERQEELAAAGLLLEPFGGDRWRLRRVPAFLAGLPDLTVEVVRGVLGPRPLEDSWRAVLGRLACLPAVRAGHRLHGADAQALLDALRACHTPWVCPHGRPTALRIGELDLARRFGRRNVRATTGKDVRTTSAVHPD